MSQQESFIDQPILTLGQEEEQEQEEENGNRVEGNAETVAVDNTGGNVSSSSSSSGYSSVEERAEGSSGTIVDITTTTTTTAQQQHTPVTGTPAVRKRLFGSPYTTPGSSRSGSNTYTRLRNSGGGSNSSSVLETVQEGHFEIMTAAAQKVWVECEVVSPNARNPSMVAALPFYYHWTSLSTGTPRVQETGGSDSRSLNPFAMNFFSFGQMQPMSTSPMERYGHTAVILQLGQSTSGAKKHVMVVYGGNTKNGNSSNLYVFDLSANTWTEMTPQGSTKPSKVIYHSAIVRPGCMYPDFQDCDRMIIFGGTPQRSVLLSDIWEYSLHSNSWRSIVPRDGPLADGRRRSASAVYRRETDSMWVFGGYDGRTYLSDCLEFSFKTLRWRKVDTTLDPSTSVPALHGHCAVMTSDERKMIIIGAAYPFKGSEIGLWEFDFANERWSKLVLSSTEYVPRPCKHAVAVVLSERYILHIGGIADNSFLFEPVAVFDLKRKCWVRCAYGSSGPQPRSRAWHSAVVDRSALPITVYLYGGKVDQQNRCGDLYRLRIPSLSETDTVHIGPDSIQADFSRLYPDDTGSFKKFSDITLISRDGREFQVHRNILALRCPFFFKMFELDWADSTAQEVPVDITASTLDMILHYIYGHTYITIQSETPEGKTRALMDVILAANMLCMDEFEKLCCRRLERSINKGNAVDILRFAKVIGGASGKYLRDASFNNMERKDLEELVDQLLDESVDMSLSSLTMDDMVSEATPTKEDKAVLFGNDEGHSQESIEAFDDLLPDSPLHLRSMSFKRRVTPIRRVPPGQHQADNATDDSDSEESVSGEPTTSIPRFRGIKRRRL